jgi:hypothetical protein
MTTNSFNNHGTNISLLVNNKFKILQDHMDRYI